MQFSQFNNPQTTRTIYSIVVLVVILALMLVVVSLSGDRTGPQDEGPRVLSEEEKEAVKERFERSRNDPSEAERQAVTEGFTGTATTSQSELSDEERRAIRSKFENF